MERSRKQDRVQLLRRRRRIGDNTLLYRGSRSKFETNFPFGNFEIKFSPRLNLSMDLFCQLSLPTCNKFLNFFWFNLTSQLEVNGNFNKHRSGFGLFRPSSGKKHISHRRRELTRARYYHE